MFNVLKALVVTVPLFFVACATLSQKDCLQGDWEGIGLRDGLEGKAKSRLQKHVEACAEYGVSPDKLAYDKGYERGILQYCDPKNGFSVGISGDYYEGVCAGHKDEKSFLRNYELGREMYGLQQQMQSMDRSISQLEDDLFDDQKRDQHSRIRSELRYLRDKRAQLDRKLERLQVEAVITRN